MKENFLYRLGGTKLKLGGIYACMNKAISIAYELGAKTVANIGDANARWPQADAVDAQLTPNLDFNTCPLPFEAEKYELVVCEQVIEHLHNTLFFAAELNRICRKGGTLLISTENLLSVPNLFAMACGKAPFSMQMINGIFMGGWKEGLINPEFKLPMNHPCYAGIKGHVRVMTMGQIKDVLNRAGFRVEKVYRYCLNHFVLLRCTKVESPAYSIHEA